MHGNLLNKVNLMESYPRHLVERPWYKIETIYVL